MRPAQRVIALFGSPYRLAAALTAIGIYTNPVTVYRWTYPRAKGGCDGRIPSYRIDGIKRAGRHAGILVTEELFLDGE